MIEIEYRGANTVTIGTKKTKLVADPKLSLVGLKDASTKDAIELVTEERFATSHVDAKLFVDGPGEYEIGEFSIRGIPARRWIDTPEQGTQTTVYRIEVEGVRIALLGNIAEKLDETQLEMLGVVDMVILPVGGGGYTLDATAAAAMVRAIDVKTVIPVHYGGPGLKYEVPQDDVSVFEKELGGEVEKTAKYKLKTASALPQTMTIIELERS